MSEFKIRTAQNVTLKQNPAGIAQRLLALIVDLLLLMLFYWTIIWLMNKLHFRDKISVWTYYMVLILPYLLYFPILQYWNNGQTLGKMLLKIRVVKTDNSHPGIGDFLIRWVIRLFEVNPVLPFAVVFVLINEKKQRLGDIAAGTTVVSEKQEQTLSQSIFEEINPGYKPVFPQVQTLNDRDVQLIKTVFNEAKQRNNVKVLNDLAQKVENVLEIVRPSEMNTISFIDTILKDFNYYAQQ